MATNPRRLTIEEVEAMSPEERRARFQEHIVWDLDELPDWVSKEFLARSRAKAEERLRELDIDPDQR